MVIFVDSNYIYKPTPPRSKSTATGRKPAPKQDIIFDKLQQIRSSNTAHSTPRHVAAAIVVADSDRGYRPGIRRTGTVYRSSDKANDNENDDHRDLPTIEELLLTKLQEQGVTATDHNPGHKERGVEEAAADERAGVIDRHETVLGDNFGGSPEDPTILQRDSDSSASEAEVNDNVLRAESAASPGAGLFDGPETAVDPLTTASPCGSDGWHDIDDFPETAPYLPLAGQGASTSNSTHLHTPSSRLSSEPLHDSISTEGSRHARSEVTTSSRPPPRHCRASPETQLNQEGRLHTGRGVADENGLANPATNNFSIGERAKEQEEVDKDNGTCQDDAPHEEANFIAPVVVAERVGESPSPSNRRQSLNLNPSLDPSHNKAGSRSGSGSDDEFDNSDSAKEPRPIKRKHSFLSNNTEDVEDIEEPRPIKRKRSFFLQNVSMHKKPKSLQRSPRFCSQHNQDSRVTTVSSKGQLSSPAQTIDSETPLDDSDPVGLSRDYLPVLIEVTFRPHSLHCVSFTAEVRNGCDGQGVSVGQLRQLIESIGHMGKIDDMTINPTQHNSFSLAGFSRLPSSPVSSGLTTVSVAAEASPAHRNKANRIRSQHSRVINATSRISHGSELSSSDGDSGFSNSSDSEPGGYGTKWLDKAKEGVRSTGKRRRWSRLENARLRAYMKESKSWPWIFRKFPGRTSSGITQHWKILTQAGDSGEDLDMSD